jgi:transposase
MPNRGVSMYKIKQILRLSYEVKLSQRQIAKSLNLSSGVVNKYLQFAAAKGLGWPLPEEIGNEDYLQKFLLQTNKANPEKKEKIDFQKINQELKRKGVTLQLLWEEYKGVEPKAISYSQFCLLYRNWNKTQPCSMRQTHKAGDKAFVDYAGQTVKVIDPDTGEVREAQIFVGILGASNYTYVEATWTQRLPDWIGSHVRMLEFFGGVPALIVPDNLRSGVSKACRYDPDINPTYADFIEYYGAAVLPTRPVKPKDKAKVENAVLVVERWILARLRNQQFFSLADLNNAIRDLVQILNQKPFKKLPGSRATAFAEIDKSELKPLPQYPYEYTNCKKARVNVDYHVELDHHYYSVPHPLIGKEIMLRYTEKRIECWFQGRQVALHVRSYKNGMHTTLQEHMPKAHLACMAWTPGKFLNWAQNIGQSTLRLVKYLLDSKPHPEQGYRSCLGLLSLSKKFGVTRLDKACERAWQLGTKTRRSVASILEHNLENASNNKETITAAALINHENIRGKDNYC